MRPEQSAVISHSTGEERRTSSLKQKGKQRWLADLLAEILPGGIRRQGNLIGDESYFEVRHWGTAGPGPIFMLFRAEASALSVNANASRDQYPSPTKTDDPPQVNVYDADNYVLPNTDLVKRGANDHWNTSRFQITRSAVGESFL